MDWKNPKQRAAFLDLHSDNPREGPGDRVVAVQGDMTQLDLQPGSVDLVWCEGAVYRLGVAVALTSWCKRLDESGCIAFAEPVFLNKQLPSQVIAQQVTR